MLSLADAPPSDTSPDNPPVITMVPIPNNTSFYQSAVYSITREEVIKLELQIQNTENFTSYGQHLL